MPTYSKTITVKEDIQTCFDFVADFRNLNKWNPHDEAELITKEPLREGSMLLKYEIIEWGEPLRASLKTETKGFEIIDTLFFSATSKGTEITYSVNIKYKGLYIILGLFLGRVFKKLMDNIYNLEEILGTP
jgi:hypothetical protein